ncbi:MAG: component of SufBCD complex [Rhodobacteraceae bacterium]|nr:component of SufBCD complex [Paracoccaceae bacterium]
MEGFYEEVIGSRSFASVWYWIVFALVWTRTTHWTLGVPYEDARMGRKHGGQYQVDFETVLEINTRKTLEVFDNHNIILTALAAFFLTTIFTLGFLFRIQFMQAGFLLLFPLSLVGLLSIRLAHSLTARPLHGEELYKAYVLHRRIKQLIGAVAIMFSAFWGVGQTLYSPYAFGF